MPAGYVTKKATGKEFAGMQYRMQVSPLDCTGCGNCVEVCPAKVKALSMEPLASQLAEQDNWTFAMAQPEVNDKVVNKATVKNSQALKPLFEFSGACAGCGETPYVKLVTQLFGDRMITAIATGCVQACSLFAPTFPFTVNEKGVLTGYTGNRRLLGVQSATLEESESDWFSKQMPFFF